MIKLVQIFGLHEFLHMSRSEKIVYGEIKTKAVFGYENIYERTVNK